jgi:hypothetical protein
MKILFLALFMLGFAASVEAQWGYHPHHYPYYGPPVYVRPVPPVYGPPVYGPPYYGPPVYVRPVPPVYGPPVYVRPYYRPGIGIYIR